MKKIHAPLFLLVLLALVSCGSARYTGSGAKVAQTDRKQGYTEWTSDSLTLRLYS